MTRTIWYMIFVASTIQNKHLLQYANFLQNSQSRVVKVFSQDFKVFGRQITQNSRQCLPNRIMATIGTMIMITIIIIKILIIITIITILITTITIIVLIHKRHISMYIIWHDDGSD